jgi:hypothetical protein
VRKVIAMPEIENTQARLEAASDLPGLLAVAWDAFSLLLAACQDSEDQSAELFAAFAFAAAAAAEGRLVIAGAPSLPPDAGQTASSGVSGEPDPDKLADALAGLAERLGERLLSAAREAADPSDRDACQDAAAQAARVCEILAPDRP